MTTVGETLDLPGGGTPAGVTVKIGLHGAGGKAIEAWVTAGGQTVIGQLTATLTNGAWSADLVANSLLTPSGTVYKRTITGGGFASQSDYFSVPTSGTHTSLLALLTDPPASIQPSTYAALDARVDALEEAGGGAVRIEDEGTSVVAAASSVNFAGAGVTVTDAGSNEALVTIPGGAVESVDGQTGAVDLSGTYVPQAGFAETVQDLVGAMATDGTTVNFTYDDTAGTLTAEVQGLTSANLSDFAEAVRDRVGATLVAGTNISVTVDDPGDTVTIAVTGLTAASLSDFAEAVDDRVAALLVAGAGVTLTYNDGAGTLTVATSITQYTDEMVRDVIGVALTAGTGITITPNDGADTITVATTITQYTDEMARDALGTALTAGTGITITPNDGADTITIAASSSGGAIEFISRTVVGAGGVASVDLTSIPQTYEHLQLWFMGTSEIGAGVDDIRIRFNGDTGSNYDLAGFGHHSSQFLNGPTSATTSGQIGCAAGGTATAGCHGIAVADIFSYTRTNHWKGAICRSGDGFGTTNGTFAGRRFYTRWKSTAAINQITVFFASNDIAVNSVICLYGVKGS